jgi:hypothetical protein
MLPARRSSTHARLQRIQEEARSRARVLDGALMLAVSAALPLALALVAGPHVSAFLHTMRAALAIGQ